MPINESDQGNENRSSSFQDRRGFEISGELPSRRDLLKLATIGGVVFASGLAGAAQRTKKSTPSGGDFFFLQLSDTHWGYSGAANPEADVTLKKAVATINAIGAEPDFVVFTGDLTHNTDDAAVRRKRMTEFRDIASTIKIRDQRLLPGEHDAAKDKGAMYREVFGQAHYSFDHKGVHFVALDNVSDPEGAVGAEQIDWLSADLKAQKRDARIVVLTHRPLFDLLPAVGVVDEGRRQGDRSPAALPQRHRVLRSHPPGAPPPDRAHRAPRGALADLPAAGAGRGAQEGAAAVGSGRARQGARLPADRRGVAREQGAEADRARARGRTQGQRAPRGAEPAGGW